MAEPMDSFDEAPAEKPGQALHLADYWATIVKRRWLILACLALAILLGILGTMLTKPMYKATVELDVVRQQPTLLNFMGGQGGLGNDSEFLPSQIQLMQSREVGERVVRRLNLFADPGFNPKHFKQYRPDKAGKVATPSNEDLMDAAIDIKDNIDASIVRGTSLVDITYTAPTPELAAMIANAIAESYVDWNAESRFKALGQSAKFLASQIEQGKAELDAKEKDLLAFGRQKDILSYEIQGNPTLQKLDALNRDHAAAVADRVSKEARYEEIRNTAPEALAEASGMSAQLRADQQKLEREYAEKLNVYKPEWPAMQQLKAQIEKGSQNLATMLADGASKAQEAARTDYLTALRREQNLAAMLKSQQSEAQAQGGNAVEYRNLRVEIDMKRALLDNLLKQQGETELVSRLREEQVTNVRIVDRALPPELPFKPSLKKNLLVSVFLGGGLGIGLAFLFAYLDRSLRTPEQVEQYLQLASLGVIPAAFPPQGAQGLRAAWKGKGRRKSPDGAASEENVAELRPHEDPRSTIAEAYRAFRTALLLSRAGGVKSVVITSGFPQEGKTTTAVNLAVVLGQLGRRVLLVDADLHQSRVHRIFRIPNRVGLVSILAEGLEPSRAIVKTNLPGVFVVPAGPDSPNPSALLSSEAMRKFLELAATNFDHVVVDSPPVLPVSDTLVFAQQLDGVVLCVRGGVTPREEALRARDRILRSGVSILGVVINAVEPEAGGYRTAYYGYPAVNARGMVEEPAESPAAETV